MRLFCLSVLLVIGGCAISTPDQVRESGLADSMRLVSAYPASVSCAIRHIDEMHYPIANSIREHAAEGYTEIVGQNAGGTRYILELRPNGHGTEVVLLVGTFNMHDPAWMIGEVIIQEIKDAISGC